MAGFAEQLITELDAASKWPLPREQAAQETVVMRRAFRRADKPILKRLANWDTRAQQLFVGSHAREYVIDPLARRLAHAFADFLFGEDPTIKAAAKSDQDWYDQIIEGNELPSSLQRAERICYSEGEIWWHCYTDREAADVPLVEFTSRSSVVPLWRAGRPVAIAFITEVYREKLSQVLATTSASRTPDVVWRHVEVHEKQRAENLLYRGEDQKLGERVNLASRPETADLPEVWDHGLDMLAGRIVNENDDNPTLGDSDYDQISDLLLALNEARTIGAENTRLTAKKRLFMATSLAQPDQDGNPVMPVDDDIILTDPAGGTLGEGAQKPPVTEVEYSYDAAPLIAHVTDLVDTIATRCGVVVQLVTQPQQLGRAESGTAIRMRFLPTVSAANGKAKPWDDQLPKILQRLALIDALPEAQGGFNRSYAKAGELPSVERGSILPTDEQEVIASHAQAVQAEIESRWTAIKELHQDWTDEQVQEEIDRIDADKPNLMPPAPPDGVPSPAPGEPAMPPEPAPLAA